MRGAVRLIRRDGEPWRMASPEHGLGLWFGSLAARRDSTASIAPGLLAGWLPRDHRAASYQHIATTCPEPCPRMPRTSSNQPDATRRNRARLQPNRRSEVRTSNPRVPGSNPGRRVHLRPTSAQLGPKGRPGRLCPLWTRSGPARRSQLPGANAATFPGGRPGGQEAGSRSGGRTTCARWPSSYLRGPVHRSSASRWSSCGSSSGPARDARRTSDRQLGSRDRLENGQVREASPARGESPHRFRPRQLPGLGHPGSATERALGSAGVTRSPPLARRGSEGLGTSSPTSSPLARGHPDLSRPEPTSEPGS